jgi:hypothetical protein
MQMLLLLITCLPCCLLHLLPLLLLSVQGKFGGLFASMPGAMVSGLFCVMFGCICAGAANSQQQQRQQQQQQQRQHALLAPEGLPAIVCCTTQLDLQATATAVAGLLPAQLLLCSNSSLCTASAQRCPCFPLATALLLLLLPLLLLLLLLLLLCSWPCPDAVCGSAQQQEHLHPGLQVGAAWLRQRMHPAVYHTRLKRKGYAA